MQEEADSFICDSNPDLARHPMSTSHKLTLERHHIEMFQKPESEVVVNLEKRPDDGAGESFFHQVVARHAQRVAERAQRQITKSPPAGSISTRIKSA